MPTHCWKFFLRLLNSKPVVLVFMLDFSSQSQIVNVSFNDKNLIDVFMKANNYRAVVKTFTIVKGIFYPISSNAEQFKSMDYVFEWSKNNYSFIFNSWLSPITTEEEVEEYENSDEEKKTL